MKFDSSGKLLFSTYLGGTRNEEGLAVAVDSQNNIYLAGRVSSSEFRGQPHRTGGRCQGTRVRGPAFGASPLTLRKRHAIKRCLPQAVGRSRNARRAAYAPRRQTGAGAHEGRLMSTTTTVVPPSEYMRQQVKLADEALDRVVPAEAHAPESIHKAIHITPAASVTSMTQSPESKRTAIRRAYRWPAHSKHRTPNHRDSPVR